MMHQHTHDISGGSDTRLVAAIGVNVLLTVVQVVAGVVSGSLSLLADALHNLSDAGSMLLALIARRISRWPADEQRTYGYGRAETIGTLINATTLALIGLYLIYEAFVRLAEPRPIEGWIVVVVAVVALVIDVGTAMLTWSMSKTSMNIRAAFVHNVADALGSLGVILAGILILAFDLPIADTVVTLLIASYVLWQSIGLIRKSVQILMDGIPEGLCLAEVAEALESIDGVDQVHHLHIRNLGEHERALECHVATSLEEQRRLRTLRTNIGSLLSERFSIMHATIEFEPLGMSGDEHSGLVTHH